MRIIAVDDEKIALENICDTISQVAPEAEIVSFRSGDEVLKYLEKNTADVAFCDIEMRGLNGIELAKKMKIIAPGINIIFATGFDSYMEMAFDLRASGYLTKPITKDRVKKELDNLRNPIEVKKDGTKRIKVQTFGNFEIFVDGKPVSFKYTKSKELIAYLVDRKGAVCNNNEQMAILFEDDLHKSYLQKLHADITKVFKDLNCEEVISQQWGGISIVPDMIECDYYEWEKGTPSALNAYHGEYMSQYSWSEFTNGAFGGV